MNKNIIQFIVDENGQYISIPVGRVKAKSNLTTRIQLVTPITASTAVNYLIYDSKNINKKQYLIPTGDLGSAVVDPNNPNYNLVAGWKVYEADIYAPILSVISRYRTGKVGMSFEFIEQVPNALCVNFVDYFSFTKELPETANNGDYFICEDYNFWLNDNLYNKGDILVWYGDKWNNGGILPKALTETVDISVDPAISYPTEEVDETAFGNAIGEITEDVAELDTRLNGVEATLNDKQDKVDTLLETTDKTVVGAINEVREQELTHYNVLNDNKLDKNFNLLVERVYAQLTDFVAIRSGDETLKMSLETLRAYLTQGLVGLTIQILEKLPLSGVGNIYYLIPMVDSIEHFETFADLPSVGTDGVLYVVDSESTGGTSGWYVWDDGYVNYNLGFYEYIWLEELNKFEKIGSTDIDLTGIATESWTLTNFVAKTQLSGGTTGQILAKKSNTTLDVEWVDKPTAPIQEIQVDGVEVTPVDGVVNIEMPTISLNGVEMLRDPDKTYLVVKIPTDNDEFTLLTNNNLTSGGWNYNVSWGDGSETLAITSNNPKHTYEKAGIYMLEISGNFKHGINVGSPSNANKSKYIKVYIGNNVNLDMGNSGSASDNYIFLGCNNLIGIYAESIENISGYGVSFASNCTNLEEIYMPKLKSIAKSFQGFISFASNCPNLKKITTGNIASSISNFGTTAFNNVNLTNFIINDSDGNLTDANINTIIDNFLLKGGSFNKNTTIQGSLQIEKTPTSPNDVVRKTDLDALSLDAENITYNNTTSGLSADNVQDAVDELESTKQDNLVSGVNIRTINNTSLLGSGDITISGDGAINGIDYLKNPDKTYLVIKTPADNDTFTLLTGNSGNPNYTIEWGDGVSENITTTDNPSHEYSKAGMYLITISGAFENGIMVGSSANVNKDKIIEVYGGTNYPTGISGYIFTGCTNLITANFPRLVIIGNYVFQNCSNLTTATFPSATSIGGSAFESCTSLTTANFPNVTSIGLSAFSNCTNLTIATFPNVASIGLGIFNGCTNLATANFPNATSIEGSAFSDCTNLKTLTLGNVVTTATGTRFKNVKLVNLTIAQDVTEADIDRIKQFYADNGGVFTGAQINSI